MAAIDVTGRRAFPRLYWGAVMAGVLLALSAHVVLGLIGVALGIAALPSGSRAVGAAAAIWALVTPFVATLLGAWLACRVAGAEDTRAGALHGVLVWCIGLIAGALFLTGTGATGMIRAGAAAGALSSAQRAETGRGRAPQARTVGDEAAMGAAAGAGGGALAAIAGLLGGVVGAGLSQSRGGRGLGGWRSPFRHHEERGGAMAAGGRYGGTYGTGEPPHLGEPGVPGGTVPPGDPYGRH